MWFIDLKYLGKNKLSRFLQLGILLFSFLIPYFLLRFLYVNQDIRFFEGLYLFKNLTSPLNVLGIVFVIAFFHVRCATQLQLPSI